MFKPIFNYLITLIFSFVFLASCDDSKSDFIKKEFSNMDNSRQSNFMHADYKNNNTPTIITPDQFLKEIKSEDFKNHMIFLFDEIKTLYENLPEEKENLLNENLVKKFHYLNNKISNITRNSNIIINFNHFSYCIKNDSLFNSYNINANKLSYNYTLLYKKYYEKLKAAEKKLVPLKKLEEIREQPPIRFPEDERILSQLNKKFDK
jgi:hypothetical protein